MTVVTTIGNCLLVLAAIPAVASVAVFCRVTWWRSRWGRHLFAYMSSIAVVMTLGCIRLLIGDSLVFASIRVGAFVTVVIALWWRLFFVLQAYSEGSPDDGKPFAGAPPIVPKPTRLQEHAMSTTTLRTQVVSKGREALSRATRQAIQALIPTLLVMAGGSTVGINVEAVATLAGMTALVSVLKSALGFKVGPLAPTWAQIAERALTAAAGTAVGLVTVDGVVPATEINWQTTLTASIGSAVTALAMFYTNPPAVPADPLDEFVAAPHPEESFTEFPRIDGGRFPTQRDGGYANVSLILQILTAAGVLLLLLDITFR